MVKVADTLREHLWGIVNPTILGVINDHLKAVKAKIQEAQKRACGCSNRARSYDAIRPIAAVSTYTLSSPLSCCYTKS